MRFSICHKYIMANPIDPSISSKKNKYVNISGLQAFYDELPSKLTVDSAKSAGSAAVANNAQNLGGTAANNVINSAKSGAAASAWVTANQTDITNLKGIKTFKTIAGINATTSADSLSIVNGGNISVTTANKTITLSAKDTTYTSLNGINTNEYKALTGVSGVTSYFTNGSAKSADKATSATSASILTNKNIKVSSADYAVSAGAAPVAPHDHEYLVKVNGTDGTALSIKNDIGLKVSGNNVKYYVSGQDIYISAKDTTYGANDFITASSATNISNAYTWSNDWNSTKTNLVKSANSGAAASAWITAHKDDYLAKSYSSNSAATFAGTANSANYATKAGSATSAQVLTNTGIKVASATSADYATKAGSASKAETLTNTAIKVNSSISADYATKAGSSTSAAVLTNTNIKVSSATSADYATLAGSASSADTLTNKNIKVSSATSADYASLAGSATNAANLTNTAITVKYSQTANYANSAGSATKLTSARNIAASGDVTWSVSFNGAASVTGNATVNNVPWKAISAHTGTVNSSTTNKFTTPKAVYDFVTASMVTKAAFIGPETSLDNFTTPYDKTAIYLVGPVGTGTDRYNEYVITGTDGTTADFLLIGDTSTDLSDYHKTADFNTWTAARFDGNSAKWSKSATSATNAYNLTNKNIKVSSATSADYATNAGTANYATSAGAAPFIAHDHNYKISAGTTAFNVSSNIQLSAGTNIGLVSAGTNIIGITAKDTIPNNKTITITSGASPATGSFTLNQNSDKTITLGTMAFKASGDFSPSNHNHNYKLSGAGTALDVSAGINLKPNGNIAISTAANTINISAKDTTYTSLNSVNSTEYSALTGVSGVKNIKNYASISAASGSASKGSFAPANSADKFTLIAGNNIDFVSGANSLTISSKTYTIPTVNNKTITITTAASPSTSQTFTLNQSTDKTISFGTMAFKASGDYSTTDHNHNMTALNGTANFFSGTTAAPSALSALTSKSALSAGSAAKAASAGTAANVNASQWNADSARYILFGENKASTTVGYDSDFTYNPSSNKLLVKNISSTNITATTFSGNLSGTAIHSRHLKPFIINANNGSAHYYKMCTLTFGSKATPTTFIFGSRDSGDNNGEGLLVIRNDNYQGTGNKDRVYLLTEQDLSLEFKTSHTTDNTEVYVKVGGWGTIYYSVLNTNNTVTTQNIEVEQSVYDAVPTTVPVYRYSLTNHNHYLSALNGTATYFSGTTAAPSALSALTAKYALSAKAAPVASHTIASHSDTATYFSGNSARSACSATSAKNAGTATYATSAGAAPVASHNHNYTISANTTAFNVSAGIQLSAGTNINITSAGTKAIGISARNDIANASDKSTYFDGTSALYAKSATSATNAAKAADSDKLGGVLPGGYALSGHNHAYKLSGNGIAVNVSAGVNFKPSGSNIQFFVSGNDIYISAKNDNSTAYIPSGFQVSGINGTTTGVYYLSALKLNAGTNIGFTSASNSQITITAKDTTYTTANFITATHLSNIQTASGYAADWNTNKAGLTNSAKSGWSAWSAVTANSSTWATNTDTKVSQTVTSDNVFYPILTKDSSGTTTVTAGARFADVVTVNPSTKMVRANKFGITSSATMEYNTATNSVDFIFN